VERGDAAARPPGGAPRSCRRHRRPAPSDSLSPARLRTVTRWRG
jgi:hypothetical protein